nr:hypothetical protein [Tanacetum cinerariifolium]
CGEEKGDEFGLNSNDDVVPKVEEVPLVDGVLEDAFGGKGDDDFDMGEGVLVSSSSLVKYTKCCVQSVLGIQKSLSHYQSILVLSS